MFPTPCCCVLCTSHSSQLPKSYSPDTSGKANTEPASKARLESCKPACSRQSQAAAAALRGQGSGGRQPGRLAQGTPSWGRLPAKQGAEPSWERQASTPGMGFHGRLHAEGAGSRWQGESRAGARNALTVSPNQELAWKHRLSASAAAWHGGADSLEHRCGRSDACSAVSSALLLDAAACEAQLIGALQEGRVCSEGMGLPHHSCA